MYNKSFNMYCRKLLLFLFELSGKFNKSDIEIFQFVSAFQKFCEIFKKLYVSIMLSFHINLSHSQEINLKVALKKTIYIIQNDLWSLIIDWSITSVQNIMIVIKFWPSHLMSSCHPIYRIILLHP